MLIANKESACPGCDHVSDVDCVGFMLVQISEDVTAKMKGRRGSQYGIIDLAVSPCTTDLVCTFSLSRLNLHNSV